MKLLFASILMLLGLVRIVPGQVFSSRFGTNGLPGAIPAVERTGRVIVQVRGRDGSQPVGGNCMISPGGTVPQAGDLRLKDQPSVWPTVAGSNGNWIIHNVLPRTEGWVVLVNAPDFVATEANLKVVNVQAGQDVTLPFVLLRGGAVKGRILDAETGQSISRVKIEGGSGGAVATDSEGDFTLKTVIPGSSSLIVKHPDYVSEIVRAIQVKDEEVASIPERRLRRGGWISGRLILPTDATPAARESGYIRVSYADEKQRSEWPDALLDSKRSERDGTFRLGPLPAGLYLLRAAAPFGKLQAGTRVWEGAASRVRVEVGKETKDILLELTPKLTSQ